MDEKTQNFEPTPISQSSAGVTTTPIYIQPQAQLANTANPLGIVVSVHLDPSPDDTIPQKPRFKFILFIIFIAAVLCIGAVSTYFILQSRNSATQQDTRTSNQAALQLDQQGTSTVPNIPQRLLYYKSTSTNMGLYTLTDQNNKVIKQFNDKPFTIRALTDSGRYLVSRDTNGDVRYKVIDDKGIRDFTTPASSSVKTGLYGKEMQIFIATGDDTLLYLKRDPKKYNEGIEYPYELYTVNLTSGVYAPIALPQEIKDNFAMIVGVSADREHAYFLGTSNDEREKYAASLNKITGNSKFISENDPLVKEVYKLWVKRSILDLDLASTRVVGTDYATLPITYYHKYWVSPNGKHILYSRGDEIGQVQYMKVGTDNVQSLNLPTKSSPQVWGGSTSAPSPMFSPDGNYKVYDASIHADGETGKIGIINLDNKTIKIYDTRVAIPLVAYKTWDHFAKKYQWLSSTSIVFYAAGKNFKLDTTTGVIEQLTGNYGALQTVYEMD